MAGAQSVFSHFIYLDPQSSRLAGEKCSRSGGTQGIHGIVDSHTVFHQNDFGVLPADFKNGADVRIKRGGTDGVCSDLIFHDGCPDDHPGQPPCAACRTRPDNLIAASVKLIFQQPNKSFYR